jgi:hypothetical protein
MCDPLDSVDSVPQPEWLADARRLLETTCDVVYRERAHDEVVESIRLLPLKEFERAYAQLCDLERKW